SGPQRLRGPGAGGRDHRRLDHARGPRGALRPSRQTAVMTGVDTLGVARRSGSGVQRHGRWIRLGFRLHASDTDPGVDALLECSGDRWVAILTDGGRTETGLGASARTALTVALQSLAP